MNKHMEDKLKMEQEFVGNQEAMKPQEEKNAAEREQMEELRGTPLDVGTMEEIIDDNHAIVSSSSGPEHYVSIMSFVDKDKLEPGSTILTNHKNMSVVGILDDDADPMVNVMKVEKKPTESYADVGGLEDQIQEIKESVELPLTRPDFSIDMELSNALTIVVPHTRKHPDGWWFVVAKDAQHRRQLLARFQSHGVHSHLPEPVRLWLRLLASPAAAGLRSKPGSLPSFPSAWPPAPAIHLRSPRGARPSATRLKSSVTTPAPASGPSSPPGGAGGPAASPTRPGRLPA